MKKRLLFFACLLILTCSSAYSFATPPDVVVVRVEEWAGKTTVAIARNGRPEELVRFDSGNGDQSLKSAATGYQRLIQRLYQEGYVLQSTFSTGEGAKATLVFVKHD